MAWPRSPLPARGLHRSIDNSTSELEESDDVEEVESVSWTPLSSDYRAQPPTPVVTPPKPPFQPSYEYDEREEARVLQTERRATRLRNCVCCGLCVFAAVVGLLCFGVVLSGSPIARAQALSLMDRVETSAMVQFKITPKPHVVLERYGKRREDTTDFYGFTYIHGELFPSVSYDRGSARRMSFNGWFQAYTNTTMSYDVLLSDHRGFRIMRSVPLQHTRSRCATFDDVPPLHYLRSCAARAFHAQDWASFRMNCSRVGQAPVEIVFAHIPFVFCPEDLASSSFSPVPRNESIESNVSTQSQTLWMHGERMLVEVVLVNDKHEAMEARVQHESLDISASATSRSQWVEKCPYLEAPLASYTPRLSRLMDDLLGNASSPQPAAAVPRPTSSLFS